MPSTRTAQPTAGTPLELLGASAGLSVVDPATILTRLWYFDGKFLRAEGFRLDQDYVRSLAALSHQATGSGVVHGYDVSRPPTGDTLRISGGIALAPSGRVVYLPREADVGIADLIARSAGSFDPGRAADSGPATFSPCPPDTGTGPDVTVAARPLYVLTVSGIEAFCGEEERFGQLCVDACATETGRSTVVEGVCFRVRELTLALPTSTVVPFDGRHLRSRVASAYYAAERAAVPSMISGAGLATPVWCVGAAGIGGEEVPLAVFDRAGDVTSLLDEWTARRELQEQTPRRYWAWRMSMRPWDVFLAQVLQFQCQLLDLGASAGTTDDGPCGPERDALAAAADVLGAATADPTGRVEAVRATIEAALGRVSAATATATGSLLLDGGIVELPPAGYLPVNQSRPVEEQVRALFGPGVDLRFCAVRPDVVPEVLQQAQHMERISLTRGLDDPTELEEVDVLVPGGVVQPAPATSAAVLKGVVRLFPVRRQVDGAQSALTLSVVARDHASQGWSWTAAGYAEIPRTMSVTAMVDASLRAAGAAAAPEPTGDQPAAGGDASGRRDDPLADTPRRPDAEQDQLLRSAGFTQRLVSEGLAARARRARIDSGVAEGPAGEGAAADGNAIVAFWLDGTTSQPLDTLAIGDVTDVRRARATLYSRTGDSTSIYDIQFSGVLRVVDLLRLSDRTVIRTRADGVATVLQPRSDSYTTVAVKDYSLSWALSPQSGTLAVTAGDPAVLLVSFEQSGQPRHVTGQAVVHSPSDQPVPPVAGPVRTDRPIASAELDEQTGALAPGTPGRGLAESVISIIGTELATPQRDPSFAQVATERLLGGLTVPGGTEQVTGTSDWVFFTRRRVQVCAGQGRTPVSTRTYRLFHRRADRRPGTTHLIGDAFGARAVAGDLGFDPVAVVTFAEGKVELTSPVGDLRAGWQSEDRGDQILLAVVGDFGDGDGEAVALGRLATVRAALQDLADSTGADVRYLSEIPAQFHEPGLDGAMFTIATTRQVLTCITVWRLPAEAYPKAVEVLRSVGDTLPLADVFSQAGVQADSYVVNLKGDTLADPDQVASDWKGLTVKQSLLGLPSGTSDADVEAWHQRVAAVGKAIGLGKQESDAKAQTGDCGAVLLVSVEVVIG